MKKLVKTLKINKLHLMAKIDIEGKTRQNVENKQTLVLTAKIGFDGKLHDP